MGYITATTARNTHFGKQFLPALEYGYFEFRLVLGDVDGGKKPAAPPPTTNIS
jgi:hypothetical protein